jgi:uncharacterized protein (DUF362 family)
MQGSAETGAGKSRRDLLRLGAGTCGAALLSLPSCGRSRVTSRKDPPPNLFVEGGKPLLIDVHGEDLSAMLRAGIEALGGLDRLVGAGPEVLLKANYVAAQPYPVTTAADHIIAVAKELRSAGFVRTTLFESHGTELLRAARPEAIMAKLGILDQVRRHDVGVLAPDYLDTDQFQRVQSAAWSIPSPVAVHRRLHESGAIVSLPVLKRHHVSRLTCALKMHFGSVGIADRMIAHKNAASGRPEYFDHRLVHFADAVRPQLNVVDARALLVRDGPSLSGAAEVKKGVNRLVLCGDMVATDAYCARLMAEQDETFSPDMIVPQLRQAAAVGLGTADIDRVKVVRIRL